MATNPSPYLSFTFTDFSKEKGTCQFNIAPLDDTSILLLNAHPLPLGIYASLLAAIENVTVAITAQAAVSQVIRYSNTFPTDSQSQREKKWIVSYEDTVTFRRYSVEIPCAQLVDSQFKPNTDEIDLSNAIWINFVNAFEAAVVSPDGNAVNVLAVTFSGART